MFKSHETHSHFCLAICYSRDINKNNFVVWGENGLLGHFSVMLVCDILSNRDKLSMSFHIPFYAHDYGDTGDDICMCVVYVTYLLS